MSEQLKWKVVVRGLVDQSIAEAIASQLRQGAEGTGITVVVTADMSPESEDA